MIRFLLPFFLIGSVFAAPTPANHEDGKAKQLDFRVFHKYEDFNFQLEYQYRDNPWEANFKSFMGGTKYRLHNNLKVGAYFARQTGNRHDEDWDKTPTSWAWRDNSHRWENILIADLIPRTTLGFMKLSNVVAELRLRYMYNLYNDNNTLKIRPGLTYFHFGKNGPLFNAYLQHEIYMPINYGDKSIYESWTYLGLLGHFTKWFSAGPFYSFGKKTWTQSGFFEGKTMGQKYSSTDKFSIFGLSFVFRTN